MPGASTCVPGSHPALGLGQGLRAGRASDLAGQRGWDGRDQPPPSGRGAEWGASPAGEELGGEAGAGRSAEREPQGAGSTEGGRDREPPGLRGSDARSSAGVAVEAQRPQAGSRGSGSWIGERPPGVRPHLAAAERVSARAQCGRGGAHRSPASPSPAGPSRGRGAGGVPSRRPAFLRLRTGAARAGQKVPEDPPSPRGASGVAVRSPAPRGGQRQPPGGRPPVPGARSGCPVSQRHLAGGWGAPRPGLRRP